MRTQTVVHRRSTAVLAAAALVASLAPAVAQADRKATSKERAKMVLALEDLVDRDVSPSCTIGRVSTVDRRYGSLAFTNSKRCRGRGQAGNGFGVYRLVDGGWVYVSSGPCDEQYKLPKVSARVSRDLYRGQCR
jgi:hypothetical protein